MRRLESVNSIDFGLLNMRIVGKDRNLYVGNSRFVYISFPSNTGSTP